QVEASVRSLRLPQEYRQSEWYRWVWAPFEEGESTMSVVAGRIGSIIDQPSQKVSSEHFTIDPRIAIPLVVHRNQEAAFSSGKWASVVNVLASEIPALRDYKSPDIRNLPDKSIQEMPWQEHIENPTREILNRRVSIEVSSHRV